jgi:hypothetical protein
MKRLLAVTAILLALAAAVQFIAFGPDLPNVRRRIIVASDNDVVATQPSLIWAFAVNRSELVGADQTTPRN